VRALFEAESAALAAPIITDEALEELEDYIKAMVGKGNSDLSHEEADRLFHLTIAKATNNAAIIYTIDNMWKMRSEAIKVQTVYDSVCHSDDALLEKEHLAILKALKARDSGKARKAMRSHFTRMIEALLVASEEEAYREVKRKACYTNCKNWLDILVDIIVIIDDISPIKFIKKA